MLLAESRWIRCLGLLMFYVQGGRPATTIQCEELNEADIEAQLREQLQQMREQNATVEMEKAEVEARVLLLEEQVRKLSSLLSDTARQLKEAKDLPKEAEPKYKLDAGPPGTLTDEVICLQAPQLVPRLWQAARQNHQDEDAAIELDAAPSGTVAAEPAQVQQDQVMKELQCALEAKENSIQQLQAEVATLSGRVRTLQKACKMRLDEMFEVIMEDPAIPTKSPDMDAGHASPSLPRGLLAWQQRQRATRAALSASASVGFSLD
ncbi:unnamed protein product [Symbiodinium natans]|uniref:Uncharacterized protein n=1 Tax=Symbiodinium natans TaxID=878477 RepID=A0A812UX22_9DINO|nr:unnamed protein product [Symbiodinium natans]